MADEIISVWDDEEGSLQAVEIVGITAFVTSVFLTLDFPTSMMIMIILVSGFTVLKYFISRFKNNIDSLLKLMSISSDMLILVIIVLYIADTFLTWLAVIHLGIAHEMNDFVIMLWRVFGYGLGEVVRALITSVVLFLLWKSNNSKYDVGIFVAFCLLLTIAVVWITVVIGNLMIFLI